MGMVNNVEILLSYLSNGTGKYSQNYLEEVFGTFFKTTVELKILQKIQPLKEIQCPICDIPHFVTATSDDKHFYVSCELSGIMEKVNEKFLVGYKFAPSAFAEWLSEKLNLTNPTEQFEDIVWYLGQTIGGEPNFKVYLICTDDFDIVLNKYNPNSTIYLWLGDTPYNKSAGKNLISVKDLLSISGEVLVVDKNPFKALTELITKEVEESVLRTDFAIRREDTKHYLQLGRNTSLQNFNRKEPISPQTYELLKYASQSNILKEGFTLGDAVNSGVAENKRTISTLIKKINGKCTEIHINIIFTKLDSTHWIIDSPSSMNNSK